MLIKQLLRYLITETFSGGSIDLVNPPIDIITNETPLRQKSTQDAQNKFLPQGLQRQRNQKRTAVDHLCYCAHVRQVVQILCPLNAQYSLQIIVLIAVLSFIIEQLYERGPLSPRNDPIDLCPKFFLLCPHLCQFIAQVRQPHLFIPVFTMPLFSAVIFCAVLPQLFYNEL